MSKPLAEILRPQHLAEVVGQTHLLGEEGALTRLLKSGYLPSIIFWGPPGTGKTTLAYIISREMGYDFIELSGVEFSVKALESIRRPAVSKRPESTLFDAAAGHTERKVVVFVDEIHRLNKSQQAQFLPYVERGEWILIGATTENPSFEVISPLLSRSQVLVLKALSPEDLHRIMENGLTRMSQLQNRELNLDKEAREYIAQISNGDARLLLNAVEAAFNMFAVSKGTKAKKVTKEQVKTALGNLHLLYDKKGEEHYDTISALHKSMRGSDPSASVYYLGRMLEGGEDPLYVARRCVRFAAEDIGNADPMALVLANSAFEAVDKIGMPEANVILSQLVIYLARAPKSNEAYLAYARVQHDIQKYGNLPIPLKIRNAPTDLMKDLGYGKGYKYAHDFSPEEMAGEHYLPEKLQGREYMNKQKETLT